MYVAKHMLKGYTSAYSLGLCENSYDLSIQVCNDVHIPSVGAAVSVT